MSLFVPRGFTKIGEIVYCLECHGEADLIEFPVYHYSHSYTCKRCESPGDERHPDPVEPQSIDDWMEDTIPCWSCDY